MRKNVPKNKRLSSELAALMFFVFSMIILFISLGYTIGKYQIFPYKYLNSSITDFIELSKQVLSKDKNTTWHYIKVNNHREPKKTNFSQVYNGLNLITKITKNDSLEIELTDISSNTIQKWSIDWFKIWPDATHIPEKHRPKRRPGTHVHGNAILENGDIVFNFEYFGLVRLNIKGDVVWRLPYQTHHSVHLHDDGSLWVSGEKTRHKPDHRFPHRTLPYKEHTILKVSPDGEILREWSVADLLINNGYKGLLYLGSLNNISTQVKGDVLHLNDVEPFSLKMKEGYFDHNDVLISLRNINTIFVFNRNTNKIKYISTGEFVRQHDPDFIDGDTISVFDNNNISPKRHIKKHSRIVLISAKDNRHVTHFEGTQEVPFYTNIMGKHQWLPNGNVLISEPMKGRAFEINNKGDIVWEHINYIDRDTVGILEEVQRLPLELADLYSHKTLE